MRHCISLIFLGVVLNACSLTQQNIQSGPDTATSVNERGELTALDSTAGSTDTVAEDNVDTEDGHTQGSSEDQIDLVGGEAERQNTETESNGIAPLDIDNPAETAAGEQELEDRETENLGQTDLWDRIRRGFTLDHTHPGVENDLQWYASNQEYLDRVVERATPFLHFIVSETEKRGMPLEIALLPVVESAFQTFAYSHGRAAGIWQFIPGTGRLYGLKQNWWYDGRRDIWASTHAALNYLNALYQKFNDWELALASYNSGSGTVSKAIRKNKRKGRDIDFWSLRRNLPVETRGYVPRLLAISAIVADPERYGITLLSIADEPYFDRVQLDGQLDLALAAEMAELSVEEMYTLNPAFNRWATDPNQENSLLIPLDKVDQFKSQLAQLPPENRIRWIRHKIGKGESIGQIASRYNTTVKVLKKVNKMRGNTIRQGQRLIIPVAMKEPSAYTHTADKRKRRIQNTQRKGRYKQTHIVAEGDSFWTLSRKYKVGMRQLAKWNGMAPRDKLSIGQKLVIWSKRQSKKITAVDIDTSRMITPPHSKTKRWIRYIVRRGDSIARIAQKFRVTVAQIHKWNKVLQSLKYLQPGQKIKLYVDVTRQS
ncbi:MAG: LysM peptidoglycan-binding domain-containing protein [Gammaproteobacteria bacterium]|nr:LysM peptidoglycan-binding domain-containing protein [Gammaproteobacteria bacterium]MDH5803382.1 LysM peptidoglycan-binding domain-containing protein [Gammaproteobacteria bacterium]